MTAGEKLSGTIYIQFVQKLKNKMPIYQADTWAGGNFTYSFATICRQ
jgi:hypothetical protein